MKKKIVIGVFITLITAIVLICSYFLIVDVESKLPDRKLDGVQIETRMFMSRKVFTITPQEKGEKVILYFHGGAYVQEMTDKHWEFLQKLSKDTKTTIIVPDYPLTPKYTYKDVLEMTEALYKETTANVDTKNLVIMGDSAGGGLALGLEEKLSIGNTELPNKTILISPWLDTKMSNPKIEEVQPKDKDLNKFKLAVAGTLYSRFISQEETYFVNPVNGNLSKLKNIIIYTGTYDILNPDCHLLQERAKEVGVDIKIKEYDTAPHIWIVLNNDDLAQKAYKDMILDIKD